MYKAHFGYNIFGRESKYFTLKMKSMPTYLHTYPNMQRRCMILNKLSSFSECVFVLTKWDNNIQPTSWDHDDIT